MERTSRIASLVLSAIVVSATAHVQTVRSDVSPLGAPADRQSLYPVVSYDGRYVAFMSGASNLVAGDTDNSYDFFRYDRLTGEMIRGDAVPLIGGGFTPPPPFVPRSARTAAGCCSTTISPVGCRTTPTMTSIRFSTTSLPETSGARPSARVA